MANKNRAHITGNTTRPFICRALLCFLCLLFTAVMTAMPTGALAQTQAGTQTQEALETGRPIERELAGGQSHSYSISLTNGQYVRIIVEQKGIDVALKLFGPDGKPDVSLNIANGTRGSEPLHWIAEAAGSYRLEISAAMKTDCSIVSTRNCQGWYSRSWMKPGSHKMDSCVCMKFTTCGSMPIWSS